jgi:hypothetical protein
MKIVKINNPHWLHAIAPQIDEFVKIVNVPGIYGQTLATYFLNTIQHGRNLAEFWVAFKDDTPIAFAHWFVKGLPHVGKVELDFIYVWENDSEATDLLIDEFIRFGDKHNAPLYEGDIIDEVRFRLFSRHAKKRGLEAIKQPFVIFIGRKNNDKNSGEDT